MIRHALVVDDSKSARLTLRKCLQEIDLTVDEVGSAEEALAYLKRTRPDVIFMDHVMPGMDGLAALKSIKSNPATRTIPTFMYTTKRGDKYSAEIKQTGAEGILPKPASVEALSRVIGNLKPAPKSIYSRKMAANAAQVSSVKTRHERPQVQPVKRPTANLNGLPTNLNGVNGQPTPATPANFSAPPQTIAQSASALDDNSAHLDPAAIKAIAKISVQNALKQFVYSDIFAHIDKKLQYFEHEKLTDLQAVIKQIKQDIESKSQTDWSLQLEEIVNARLEKISQDSRLKDESLAVLKRDLTLIAEQTAHEVARRYSLKSANSASEILREMAEKSATNMRQVYTLFGLSSLIGGLSALLIHFLL